MVYEKDATTGLWEWIGQALDTPGFLKTRLAFGAVVGAAAAALFTHILLQMERHNATYKAAVMEAAVGERDTQLELEEDCGTGGGGGGHSGSHGDYHQADRNGGSPPSSRSGRDKNRMFNNDDDDDDDDEVDKHTKVHGNQNRSHRHNENGALYKPGDSRRRLSAPQKAQIFAHVAVLLLCNYLLLVYLPGSVVLSFVAVAAVWVLALHSYLRDELRRGRYDRLVTLIALFFILAGCFTLITYCRLALHEGSIYQGPARIVGYDDSTYNNNNNNNNAGGGGSNSSSGSGKSGVATTVRADLEVSWGGAWGCPDEGGKTCTATVQGALCETTYNSTTTGGTRRRRRRRRVQRRRRSTAETAVQQVQDYEKEQDEQVAEGQYTGPALPSSSINGQGGGGSAVEQNVNAFEEEQDRDEEEDLVDQANGQVQQDLNYQEGSLSPDKEALVDEVAGDFDGAMTVAVEEVVDAANGELQDTVDEANGEIAAANKVIVQDKADKAVLGSEVTALEGPANSTTAKLVTQVDAEASEVSGLTTENEQLKQDLADEQSVEDQLEDEIAALEGGGGDDGEGGMYSYDDVIFEDDYWQQDWDAVWGDYACEDLFDADLEATESYNPTTPAGSDEWPTVTIYGSCQSCQAYILDYYSTQHFQTIRLYEFQSWVYLMLGFFILVAAAVSAMAERLRPAKDKEIVLLTHDGGVAA